MSSPPFAHRRLHGRACALLFAGLMLGQVSGLAQTPSARLADYPQKPVHLVVTFPPGGSSDAVVRLIAPKLAERLGQPVLIDNKPGAGGNIGLGAVAQSPADGYTLGVGAAGGLAANVSLYAKLPFNPGKDFAAVSLLAHIPFVLVTQAGAGTKDLSELIARGRAAPGQLTVGHGGNGTAMHLSVQLLRQMAGLNLTEVAYRGTGPATVDVLGAQVALAMLDLSSALPHLKSGKLKALAITSARRSSFLPEVPTMAEAGVPGYESTGWFGLVAPAGTPPAVLQRLQAEVGAVLADPQLISNARAIGVEITGSTAADFDRFIRAETLKWAEVIKASGTRLE